MAEDLPDAPWTTGGHDLPDAPWAGAAKAEPADHGLSERQKLSPIGKALNPITSYPETYNRMNLEAQEQVGHGVQQVLHPDSAWDVAKGIGNVAAGGVGYVGSPLSAAYRSVVGQPVEDVTGIPREYTEFAAQLATPGLGLPKSPFKAAPDIVPVKPEANGPLGVTLSEGQLTHDLPAVRRESAARTGQLGSKAEETAKEFAEQQAPQVAAARETVERGMDPVGGQVLAESPYEAAEMAGHSFRKEAARTKAGVTAAYNHAKDLPGEIDAQTLVGLGNHLKNDLSAGENPIILDPTLTPYASKMLQSIDDTISKLRIPNRAELNPPDPNEIVGVNLKGLDQIRKVLSEYRSGAYAHNPTDGRAASAVMKAFDDRIDAAVNGGMFNGDPLAVKAWNDARAAHADYKTTFGRGKNDPVGGVIQKIIGDKTNPPETANALADHLYGASGVNPSDLNIRVAQRMKQVLGESSPEWAAVRQGLFRRLVDKGEDVTPYGSTNIANRLNKFLNGDGRDLAAAVFTPEQRSLMKQYADLHRALEVPKGGYNSSETSTFVAPMMKRVADYIAAAVGGALGHVIAPGFHGVGEAAGAVAASKGVSAVKNFQNAKKIEQQMPIIERQMRDWQNAVRQHEAGQISKAALAARTLALSQSLDRASAVLPRQLTGTIPSAAEGEKDQGKALRGNQPDQGEPNRLYVAPQRAHGGSVTGRARAEKALPKDHQLGMKVPKGGSSCSSCHFLTSATECGNRGFQTWNGSAKLPAPKDRYCCDLYEHKTKRAAGGAVNRALQAAKGYATGGSPFDDPDTAAMMPETFVPPGLKAWTEQAAPKDLGIIKDIGSGVLNTLAYPGKVYQSPRPVSTEEMVGPAADMAMTVAGGASPFAQPGSAGVFGGRLAKTADLAALRKAEEMSAVGHFPDEIHQATGWWQGPDKKWRFEIPDAGSAFKGAIGDGASLGDVFKHDPLYEAYPQMRDIDLMPGKGLASGSYMGNFGEKGISPAIALRESAKDPRSVLLHEIQHGIQDIEGFAPGTNNYMLRPKTPAWDIYKERLAAMSKPLDRETYSKAAGYGDELAPMKDYKAYLKIVKNPSPMTIKAAQEYAAQSAYKRSAGEVESRAVEARKDFTPEQIRDIPPEFSHDIPADRRIINKRSIGGLIMRAVRASKG